MRHILILASCLALTMPVHAAERPPATESSRVTILKLEETVSREVPRDRLRAELALETSAAEPVQAQRELNARMQAVLPLTRDVPGVKVESGSYSTYADRSDKRAVVWRARQSIALTGGDAETVLDLTGKLQQKGLALVQLAYELTPEAARLTETELTTAALQRLRLRADKAAQDIGMNFAAWTMIEVGTAVPGFQPRPMMRAATMAGGAAQFPTPVAEPGTAQVQVTVRAEANLVPGK